MVDKSKEVDHELNEFIQIEADLKKEEYYVTDVHYQNTNEYDKNHD